MTKAASKLHVKAAEWNVTLEEIRETPTSLLGFGVRGRDRVVLKVTKQAGDESHSGKVLRAFAGDGLNQIALNVKSTVKNTKDINLRIGFN